MLAQAGVRLFLALLALESISVIATFQILSPIECHATEIEGLCRGVRGVFISALCTIAAFGVLMFARTPAWHRFLNLNQSTRTNDYWVKTHLVGVGIIFLPVVIVPEWAVSERILYVLMPLVIGGVLASLGALFWVLNPRSWWKWLSSERFLPLIVLLLASMIPFLAFLIETLWAYEFVSTATFRGVAIMLSAVSSEVFIDPARTLIGLPDFVVAVASQCSGIEGFALITGFMALYAILFRDTLRQRVFWFGLWPIALLMSWIFNVFRITVLILIGKHVSPDLAVNGFHSFAGWLLFTALALGVIYLAQAIPALRRVDDGVRKEGKLRDDPVAALIIPFIAFMISGVFVQAFWEFPDLGYPFQAAIMFGVLFWMRGTLFSQIKLSPDLFSIAIGLAVGLGWVWFSTPSSGGDMGLRTLSDSALILWALVRTLGTTVLVPVVEEAFFRGYVLARLNTGSPAAKVISIVVSTALFAALHGRIILAGIAGLAFAAAMLRRGRLGDAVVAHIVANATVAAVAWYTGQWSLI